MARARFCSRYDASIDGQHSGGHRGIVIAHAQLSFHRKTAAPCSAINLAKGRQGRFLGADTPDLRAPDVTIRDGSAPARDEKPRD